MPIYEFNGQRPRIDPTAFVAETAAVCGDVSLGPDASIWFGASVRGDINKTITIGRLSNVQDNCVIHVTHNGSGTSVGEGVSLGHGVILHDCTILDWCLIGMNAVVMDRAVVGPGSIVAAGSVVTPGTVIPAGMLAMGAPAKPVREVNEKEKEAIRAQAERYKKVARSYRDGAPYNP